MERTLINYLSIAIGAGLGFLFGELNGLFFALAALCTLDYITGIMVAIKRKKVSSRIGYNGILKKMAIFILVSVAHLIDMYIVQSGSVFMSMTMLYYAANESISILENSEKLGLPVPKKLKRILEQVKSDNDDDDDNKPKMA